MRILKGGMYTPPVLPVALVCTFMASSFISFLDNLGRGGGVADLRSLLGLSLVTPLSFLMGEAERERDGVSLLVERRGDTEPPRLGDGEGLYLRTGLIERSTLRLLGESSELSSLLFLLFDMFLYVWVPCGQKQHTIKSYVGLELSKSFLFALESSVAH